jgi:fibronectin type 3 domain-containing protein
MHIWAKCRSVLALAVGVLSLGAAAVAQSNPVQDDFNGSVISAPWSSWDGFALLHPADTANHAVFRMTGTQLEIAIPGGKEHNMWWLKHAQVLRPYDGSGTYEIKIDTPFTGTQQVGLSFQKDPNNFLIFMLYATDQVRAYVERFVTVDGTLYKATPAGKSIGLYVPDAGPYYLRVTVTDNVDPTERSWRFDWSPDGTTWTNIFSDVYETSSSSQNVGALSQVGIFAGNHPSTFSAYQARIDYFRFYSDLTGPPLNPPGNVMARGGDQRVDLWWDPVDGADSYAVYRSTTAGNSGQLVGTTTATSFSDLTVLNGSKYYYTVAAFRGGAAGPISVAVAAVPHFVTGMAGLPQAGLVLALNAADLAETYANGEPVGVWPNAIGPMLGATATSARMPVLVTSGINGRPAVRFDGSDDFMTLSSGFRDFTAGMSLYIVKRPSVLRAASKIFLLGNGPAILNVGLGRAGTTSGYQYHTTNSSNSFSWFDTLNGLVAGEASLVSVHQEPGAANSLSFAETAKNGVPLYGKNVFVPPIATRSLNYIAKSYWTQDQLFQGDIAEILLYNRALSYAERAAVHSYVSQKYSLTINGTTPPPPPPLEAPTGLVATAGDSSVLVSWNAVSGATGYRVLRGTSSTGPYVQVADQVGRSYTDSGVVNGTTYYYVVRAYDSTQESPNSVEVAATPAPPPPPPPLEPPGGLSATGGDASVALSWNAVTGAVGYRVLRSTSPSGGAVQVADVTARTFTDNGVTNGTTYYYVVRAYDATRVSEDSAQISVTPSAPPPPPLAAPTGVAAAAGDSLVTLTWNAVTGAAGYRVLRTESSTGSYVQIADLAVRTLADSAVVNGTTYYYVVRAYDSTRESGDSTQVFATPIAAPPPPPAEVPTNGLILLLDASALAQQLPAGSTVTSWADTSGGGNDAVAGPGAPTLIADAINGRPAVRFDGVDDSLSLPAGFSNFTAGVSLYFVMKPTVLRSGFKMLLLGNGASRQNIGFGRGGNTSGLHYHTFSGSNSVTWFNTSGGLVVGEAALFSVRQDAGTANSTSYAALSKNGIVLFGQNMYVPPVTTRSVNYIGRSSFTGDGLLQGDVAEVLLYARKLTDTEQASLHAYIAAKYGLAIP